MILAQLEKRGLIHPPKWLTSNTMYVTIMGSHAYGCSTDNSDYDLYGFCIPPKGFVFPHLDGEIIGFGTRKKAFEKYLESAVDENKNREYDIQIFSIVRYFQLLMDNNPNIIDSLFTDIDCVLHATQIANMVRENRTIFLSKKCWVKFKGYAYSQLHKIRTKSPEGKRKAIVEEYGYDVKYAAHVVRLLDEVEQLLSLNDVDLRRNREQLKAIRRGDVPEEEIFRWAADKEKQLEELYHKSTLPWKPDEDKIKKLLLDCLEHHYGSISDAIVVPDIHVQTLRQIKDILDKVDLT